MSVERLLRNFTSASARAFLIEHWRGYEAILIVAKRSYGVAPDGTVSELDEPRPIRLHDELFDGDANASIRYPGDVVDDKPGTDVVLVGTAHPPQRRSVQSMRVSLSVVHKGELHVRTLVVYGHRVFYRGLRGIVPGPSVELTPTPLRYERSVGGTDRSRQPELVDWRNPCGIGLAHDRDSLLGTPAHTIEDPDEPHAPAGFGAIAAHWSPRRELAGSYDKDWQQLRAPLRPTDFDPRHNSCAARGLWFNSPLSGTEPIEIAGVIPDRPWRFSLPGFVPMFRCDTGDGTVALASHLDTLLIDADEGFAELTWRACMPAPRKLETIRSLRILERSERYHAAVADGPARN